MVCPKQAQVRSLQSIAASTLGRLRRKLEAELGLQGLNTTSSRSLMARNCFALAVMSGMAFSTAVAAISASAARNPDESPYSSMYTSARCPTFSLKGARQTTDRS